VSRPIAQRASPRGENTGSHSRASSESRAAPHSGLSRSASTAITSQTSATEAFANRLHRPVDLVVRVGERDEHPLELGWRHEHAPFEQATEHRTEPLGVTGLRLLKVSDGV